jgi:hypothetical protein
VMARCKIMTRAAKSCQLDTKSQIVSKSRKYCKSIEKRIAGRGRDEYNKNDARSFQIPEAAAWHDAKLRPMSFQISELDSHG